MNIYKCFQESCALRSGEISIVDLRLSKRSWTFDDLDVIIHRVAKRLSDLGVILYPKRSDVCDRSLIKNQ